MVSANAAEEIVVFGIDIELDVCNMTAKIFVFETEKFVLCQIRLSAGSEPAESGKPDPQVGGDIS